MAQGLCAHELVSKWFLRTEDSGLCSSQEGRVFPLDCYTPRNGAWQWKNTCP